MTTCPAGHESQATDYCDTCGIAIPADGGSTGLLPTDGGADAPAPAAPDEAECPNCKTPNAPDALFCEACGYDFTTGTMPRPIEPPPSSLDLDAPSSPPSPVETKVESKGPSPADTSPGFGANPSPAPDGNWVAEVWIDPDWYTDQKSEDPLPSPGLPGVVPLKHSSILIGRASRSRNINPDIDLSSDNGISRRHAQLTTDGSRWFVEDLGSSNGTYVGDAIGALPTQPIPVGQKKEISRDDRIYVGAWTRIVVRKGDDGEF